MSDEAEKKILLDNVYEVETEQEKINRLVSTNLGLVKHIISRNIKTMVGMK